MYGVRRQHGARHVFFGVGLTEAAPGSNRWVTKQLELPPVNVDANGSDFLLTHPKSGRVRYKALAAQTANPMLRGTGEQRAH